MNMPKPAIENNYCRRCGSPLHHVEGQPPHVYRCDKGHVLFFNNSPAVGLLLLNEHNQVLVLVRAKEPGKGNLDCPGGFCDTGESLEQALAREVQEELRLQPADYSTPRYILSDFEEYIFGGEPLPVTNAMFVARLQPGTKLDLTKVEAEIAQAMWMQPQDVDVAKVNLPAVQAAYQWLKSNIDNVR